MSDNKPLELVDETFRDGVQSRWGMMQGYHTSEPVLGEMGEAGYYRISIALHGAQPLVSARFMKEDPRILFKMWSEKLKNTKSVVSSSGMGMSIDIAAPAENKTLVGMMYRQLKEWMPNFGQLETICCTLDEIKNQYPILFPMLRSIGIEPIPYFAIGHGPRHTEEFYASRVKEVVEKYKPVAICIKDVDGLLVADRLRKLITTFKENANGTPIGLHSHGMNGEQTYNAVVAMEMGIRRITTCIPPLAYGSSHPSVFNVIKNAEELGIPHNMDVEKLKVVSDRLTKIGKAASQPVDSTILPFDLSFYKHQMPGGVISNTTTQLGQLGLSDKLQDVLEEIPRILKEMGHPVMITPFSQFIATQAVLNVQLGRWEQCVDSMVEFAAGIYGTEDSGVAYMDQNLKDKLLSLPQAKAIQEKADNLVDYMNSEPTEEECYKRFGMSPNDGLEKFVLNYYLRGFDDAMKNVTPGGPESYKKYL
jgi:oxaloacetate decarboxylase alpha subunit